MGALQLLGGDRIVSPLTSVLTWSGVGIARLSSAALAVAEPPSGLAGRIAVMLAALPAPTVGVAG